jgi:hypothetical protein
MGLRAISWKGVNLRIRGDDAATETSPTSQTYEKAVLAEPIPMWRLHLHLRLALESGSGIVIEDRGEEEVISWMERDSPKGERSVTSGDVTSSSRQGFITEAGIPSPRDIGKVKGLGCEPQRAK